jgi:RNA polymerase sigma factor (sigma-70 family)
LCFAIDRTDNRSGPPTKIRVDAQRLFLDNLELIERIVRTAGRRHHLSFAEQEDFAGIVNVRLLENDCAVLRKFRGKSSMWTYLAAVIERHLLDFTYERWGRWRPSATADTIGPVAVLLEKLVTRDGHTLEEAMEIVRTNHKVEQTYAELRAIWEQLPSRGKPIEVSDEAAEEVRAEDTAEDLVEDAERQRTIDRLERVLAKALADLATQDRVIIGLRFDRGFSVAEIAKLRQSSVPTVHRRLDASLKHLKKELLHAGFRPTEVAKLIGHSSIIVSPLLRAEVEKFLGLVRLSKRDG